MKPAIFITAVLFATVNLPISANAENIQHVSQLLSTKECPQCDLSGSGLVMANLSGAQLRGANLIQANLSRANLSGADLSGADLSGASLYGANLTGANLTGANLTGADLRDAYLVNAILIGVSFDTAYMGGTVGIPNYAGTPEQFHRWGVAEAEKGNYTGAIEYYDRALNINPQFAPAYLGRGLARYRIKDEAGSTQDVEIAAKLFEAQKNESGYQASKNFLKVVELARNPAPKKSGMSIERILGTIGSLLLTFF